MTTQPGTRPRVEVTLASPLHKQVHDLTTGRRPGPPGGRYGPVEVRLRQEE
ncbi:hypothetical protein [Micromonospora humi]|uniref:hypothetical protein n=1 Tax=Micromonospora humi TaxID=745366 RepID=UPI00158664D8|nr:hypothetical protein [Micromonospora humi]